MSEQVKEFKLHSNVTFLHFQEISLATVENFFNSSVSVHTLFPGLVVSSLK